IFMGTPGYSPPEAIREGRYTPQADVFAWGAVFYELLSGRIPYEGPDTKTTNSYVVQGNASAPTRHDASIPEPLSTVTMTALQPLDRNRYKDASEAEQALREAWDRCLTQGLVHPAVLAMEEMAHDKTPARMHEPRNLPKPAAQPVIGADSSEVTAIDSKMLAKPFVIESQKGTRGSDDDPTTLVVREDLRPKLDKTERGVGNQVRDTAKVKHADVVSDGATDPGVPRFGASVMERRSSKAIWIVIAAVVAITLAIAVLYFAGLIK
ncbi:MAG: protein kinase, partial [Kofleriaceae bacterium]